MSANAAFGDSLRGTRIEVCPECFGTAETAGHPGAISNEIIRLPKHLRMDFDLTGSIEVFGEDFTI